MGPFSLRLKIGTKDLAPMITTLTELLRRGVVEDFVEDFAASELYVWMTSVAGTPDDALHKALESLRSAFADENDGSWIISVELEQSTQEPVSA
jgi:hypothetical protein